MDFDWPLEQLGGLCLKIGSGVTPRGGSNVYVNDGTRFIRSQNVHDLRFEFAGLAHIDDNAAQQLRGVAVEYNDVLVNITGDSVARVCLAPEDGREARVSQHVAIVRPDSTRLLCRFLAYWLVSPRVKEHLLTLASAGATRKALTKRMLETLQLPLPGVDEQQRIVSVLSALDTKIDSNHRMSEVLHAAGAALVERAQSHASTLVAVGDLAKFHNSRRIPLSASQRSLRPGPFPYYGATGIIDFIDDYLFSGRYVLVGEDGSVQTDGGHPVVQYVWGDFWVNNHAHVITFGDVAPEIGYLVLREANVAPFVTGAVQPKLSMRRLREVRLRWPRDIGTLESELRVLFELFRVATAETKTLGGLRDALLPKLISGEIRVPDAMDSEEAIGSAGEQVTGAEA